MARMVRVRMNLSWKGSFKEAGITSSMLGASLSNNWTQVQKRGNYYFLCLQHIVAFSLTRSRTVW
jgi:hypothetical protein